MAEITAEKLGSAGLITLDKPETLNALTQSMVRVIARSLDGWERDDSVRHVIIRASGGRAFSAGGDIRDLYERGRGDFASAMAFFAEEYRLNTRIREYPKPYIALIDGIVMGGGVGVSVNGLYRVGTENIRFAMPEVGIGFFPDVGGTYFLPRIPARYGVYCALSAARLKQAEAAAAGIVTHMIDAAELDSLVRELTRTVDAASVLAQFCRPASAAPRLPHRESVEACFAGESVEDILARLDAGTGGDGEFCRDTATALRSKSPTSLKIALRQMQIGETADFRTCMMTEYRIVANVLRNHDFYEGVRAAIIDKDNAPRWLPATLEAVDDRQIDTYFSMPETGDLRFD